MMRTTLPPLASNDLGSPWFSRPQRNHRHRQNDSKNRCAYISDNKCQNKKQALSATSLDEIIRHYDRPCDIQKESQVVDRCDAPLATVRAQPTNDPEKAKPIKQRHGRWQFKL